MPQNNLDQKFAQKLSNREIKPSDKAWDRLDAMLSVAEEKPKKNVSFNWLYIAAALFVGSFITFQVYNAEPLIDSRVNSSSKIVLEEKPKVETEASQVENTDQVLESKLSKAATEQNIAIAKVPKKPSKFLKDEVSKPENQETVLPQESQIAAVILPTNPPSQNTEISLPKLKPARKISVNAASLLAETDRDINYSFRERVIRKIAHASSEVAEAVVERNNQ